MAILDPNESYKQYCAAKERQSAEYLRDFPKNARDLGIAAVCTVPVDRLSARLQHLDATTGPLCDGLSPANCGLQFPG